MLDVREVPEPERGRSEELQEREERRPAGSAVDLSVASWGVARKGIDSTGHGCNGQYITENRTHLLLHFALHHCVTLLNWACFPRHRNSTNGDFP
jgi:hypothetical protein